MTRHDTRRRMAVTKKKLKIKIKKTPSDKVRRDNTLSWNVSKRETRQVLTIGICSLCQEETRYVTPERKHLGFQKASVGYKSQHLMQCTDRRTPSRRFLQAPACRRRDASHPTSCICNLFSPSGACSWESFRLSSFSSQWKEFAVLVD